MEIEYIESQRGGRLLIYQNHLFNKDKETEKGIKWRCQNRICKSSVTINSTNG
jgi:hypothetical protein